MNPDQSGPPPQKTDHTIPAIGYLFQLINKADAHTEIKKRNWILHLLQNSTPRQATLLTNAAWAYAAGEALASVPWPDLGTVGERATFEEQFLGTLPDVLQPGVLWSHSFSTHETAVNQENVCSFFKQCLTMIDILELPAPTAWTPVQSRALIEVFDHSKGYAVSAFNAGQLFERWHTLPASDSVGSVSITDLPKPGTVVGEVFTCMWENHPFTMAHNYNKVPAKALGNELTTYAGTMIERCARMIFGYLLSQLARQGMLTFSDYDRMRDWLTANRADLEQSLVQIAGDEATAGKLAEIMVTLNEDSF